MTEPRFIHLRLHSPYSLLEGAVSLKKLPEMCRADGQPAVAVTDTGNMFGALEFSEGVAKAGVQPILGCQMDLAYAPALRPGDRAAEALPVVLLAQDEAGYGNLMKLNSCAFLESGEALPHITLEELEAHSGGVICLTGGPEGPVGRLIADGQREKAEALLRRLGAMFGDRLYVELQRHGEGGGRTEAEAATEQGFVEFAYAMDLPLVATNDVYFPDREMYDAHDALICIADGAYVDQSAGRRRLTPEHCFKTQDE
ncbi:MAG: PHP domain-containing protein, partial [Pseudomonadota bacterium]